MALRTSPMGMTPSFSPSMASEKRLKASLISASSRAVMLCSLASRDWRSPGGLRALGRPPAVRFGGCVHGVVSTALSHFRAWLGPRGAYHGLGGAVGSAPAAARLESAREDFMHGEVGKPRLAS